MSPTFPPVLLTSCIYVADRGSVNLINPDERIHHTLESIAKWLHAFPKIQLVICDSSNFDFTPLVRTNFPGASVECLSFTADKELVKFHGKGYGEGEIIKYALGHSDLINQAGFFAKCTAKLWVENFEECFSEWNGRFLCKATFKNAFSFKPVLFDHVDTRFYISSKKFYSEYLLNAHQDIGGSSGKSIEDRFKEVALTNNLQKFIFSIPPLIGGVGGGTGKYYNIRRSKKLKEYLRYWILRHSSRWKPLFNTVSLPPDPHAHTN